MSFSDTDFENIITITKKPDVNDSLLYVIRHGKQIEHIQNIIIPTSTILSADFTYIFNVKGRMKISPLCCSNCETSRILKRLFFTCNNCFHHTYYFYLKLYDTGLAFSQAERYLSHTMGRNTFLPGRNVVILRCKP